MTCTAQAVLGYTFSHRVVDGVERPPGVTSFTLTSGSGHTATTIYQRGDPSVMLSPYLILLGLIRALLTPILFLNALADLILSSAMAVAACLLTVLTKERKGVEVCAGSILHQGIMGIL